MTSKKYWEKIIFDFLGTLKSIKKENKFNLLGYSFIALPGVFSPIYSSDTSWFAKNIISRVRNKKVLEIGTGTGAIACLVALKGASKVIATDINPKAVQNTLLNQQLLHISFPVRIGNVFDPIKKNEVFDIIFWNHPFGYTITKEIENDMLNRSVFDYEYNSLKRFIKNGKKHLTTKGKLLLGSSNVAKISLIKQLAKSEGFRLTLLDRHTVSAYKNRRKKMDLRIYSLEKNASI